MRHRISPGWDEPEESYRISSGRDQPEESYRISSGWDKPEESYRISSGRDEPEESYRISSGWDKPEESYHPPERVHGTWSRSPERSFAPRAPEYLDRHRRRSRSPVCRSRYDTSPERVYKGRYSRSPEHHHSSRSHIPSYKHRRSRSPEYENTRDRFSDTRWQTIASGSKDSDFAPQVKYPRRIDNAFNSDTFDEPSTSGLTRNTIETSGAGKKESVEFVEILGILSYMKDKLGVYGVPVSVIYEKAVSLEKKGINPRILLDDKDTVTLLMLLSDKLTAFILEGGGSAIQKTIMLKAQSRLKTLLREDSDFNKKDDLNAEVNIGQIARLTVGKSIVETITTIKNFLISRGFSMFSNATKEELERIYELVKDEQLRISESMSQREFERGCYVPQRPSVPPPPPVISSRELPRRSHDMDDPLSGIDFDVLRKQLAIIKNATS